MKKNPHKVFESYLKKNEGRYTKTKKFIANEIFGLSDHFEVENFIDHLRGKTKNVSRATVYRTIKQLLEASLLQKISTKDGKVFYEQSRPQNEHAHLICNICGKIFEMHDKKLRQRIDLYCENMEFNVEYQSIHIYGECKQCKEDKINHK